MTCAHCQSSEADNSWLVKACAADKKRSYKFLCDSCDAGLNMLVMQFFKYDEPDKKLKFYIEKQGI